MISIELKDVRLPGQHGLYKGELKTGNIFQIDLSVKYDEGHASFDHLDGSINYEELYEIVKQRMAIPTHLLEKLCDDIMKRIKMQYPFVKEAYIAIYKLQAPMENFEGRVGVILHKIFNE